MLLNAGTVELYGKIENQSEGTIKTVLRAIQIMDKNNIDLPNIDILQKFPISENGGWGRKFRKIDIFS